jgi:hypothetical protein
MGDFLFIRIFINMNLQEQISRIQSMMGVINESSETTDDVVGKEFWFEYHCFESPKSCDAELWYRTHNKVLVLSIVELGCGDTKLERLLEGCPRVYRVVFEDGFEYDVFEDELMESKEEFERPDAPKRNLQEQISRMKSMMGIVTEWYEKFINNEKYYDNPREVVKLHPSYKRFIKKLSSSIPPPDELRDIIEDWIIENEEEFSNIIFQNDERFINCEHAAEMVGQILDDLNLDYTLVVGEPKNQSHAWVKYEDVIIDPTKDQFPGITYDDYENSITWTSK